MSNDSRSQKPADSQTQEQPPKQESPPPPPSKPAPENTVSREGFEGKPNLKSFGKDSE